MTARKPTALKVLHNTARPDRVSPNEPTGPLLDPNAKPPPWLRDERARRHWSELLPPLANLGVVTTADVAVLALAADALGEWEANRDVVVEQGATFTTYGESGPMTRVRPEARLASDAWRRAKIALAELGMSPSSRGGVAIVEPLDALDYWERTGDLPPGYPQ